MRLYNTTTGALEAVFDDWNSLYFFRRLNDYSYHTLSIDGEDPRTALFVTDSLVQVLRRDEEAGIDWGEEYVAFHRTGVYQVSDRGRVLFSSYGRGLEDILKRRHILWRPGDIAVARGVEGEFQSGAADNTMKQYVRENLGANATTANGRMATGAHANVVVDIDTSMAGTWEGRRAYKNLLAVLSEISIAKSVDFNVTWAVVGGALQLAFHTYYPRLGTDRTGAGAAAPVVFSLEHANMSMPYLTESRMEEVTIVYVLGQGEGVNRTFVERSNAGELTISPWNRIEYAHDARNEQTVAALNNIGDGHLTEHGLDQHLSFQVLPSPGSVYRRDYFLGDLVKGRFLNVEQNRKITGVEITVADGRETVRIHFEE